MLYSSKKTVLLLFLSSFLSALLFQGCVTQYKRGRIDFPTPSPNFVPKGEYGIAYDRMWDVILKVLESNRITVAQMDKSSGRITTDYIPGESYTSSVIGLPTEDFVTRYRYTLILEKTPTNGTQLRILCALEISSTANPAWRDRSQTNPKVVSSLENWLYERIEQAVSKR